MATVQSRVPPDLVSASPDATAWGSEMVGCLQHWPCNYTAELCMRKENQNQVFI